MKIVKLSDYRGCLSEREVAELSTQIDKLNTILKGKNIKIRSKNFQNTSTISGNTLTYSLHFIVDIDKELA